MDGQLSPDVGGPVHILPSFGACYVAIAFFRHDQEGGVGVRRLVSLLLFH